jgi:transcriptional regulatory protein LEU3
MLILVRFFRDYHRAMPILDPSLTPNAYYSRSPLLFWVIISVGSRKYSKQPTFNNALSPRVTSLAMHSLNSKNKPFEAIKSWILILTWPFTSNAFYREPTFIFSGALLHMALQYGLQTPYLRVDSMTLPALKETNIVAKAHLWAYVVISYQRLVIFLYYL